MIFTGSISKGIFPSSAWGNWDSQPPTFVCWGWEVGELTPDCHGHRQEWLGEAQSCRVAQWQSPCASAGGARGAGAVSGWEGALGEELATTSLFLPGKFCGQRSLVDCSPQGGRESNTTEHAYHHHVGQRDADTSYWKNRICWMKLYSSKAGVRWKILLKGHTLIFCVTHVLY